VNIYCDESGGVGAGIMTMAAVCMDADAADVLLARMRSVLGLRGELKGSRIEMADRAFFVEMLIRLGGRAVIATANMQALRAAHGGTLPEDIAVYATLLDRVLQPWITASGGCISVEIDDGRYDPRLNGLLRGDVQAALGQWGKAVLTDSRRSAGIQIADVLANSAYQIGINGTRAPRVEALIAPFVATGAIALMRIESLPN
jgi:hypothetical protein